ncbi:TonB-dependent receptor [Novosphingobium sp.]|uniref:TonB-dependent receptor plug domain-containing protein n=1 Tax=Novosphingobium sp. TaxID=1874826 RepID=UPI0025CFDCA3|nr:TonB-dependent receptor [Novosphingobium sp.]
MAQSADSAPDHPQEPIVVTGRGLDQTPAVVAYDIRTLDRTALLSAVSGRIEDALSGVAGFQQFRRSDSRSANPSAQGVTLRALGGNATSRTAVLLDGVPMADPFFGFVPLSAIAPERLASARVTRGGGAGAFAAGAVAGTIDLTSASAADLGLLSGEASVNDRGETTLSGTIASKLGEGFAEASGRWDRGRGFQTNPLAQRIPASVPAAYQSWSAGLRGVAPIAPGIELQARGLAFQDDRTLRFAGADAHSQGEDASLRVVGRGPWQFDALGYVQARDFAAVTISSTTFRKTLDEYRTPSTGVGGKLELRPPVGGGHVLRVGADVRVGIGQTAETGFSATTGAATFLRKSGGRNSDAGVFVDDDWTLGALTLTAGVRADRWSIADGFFEQATPAGTITTSNRFASRNGWETTLRGGAAWQPLPVLTVRAAGYSGFRLPTLNELYRPFTVPPVTTQANAALINERLEGFEVGLDFAPDSNVRLSATAFADRIAHAIANVTIATNLRQRFNVDAIRARGLEFDAHVQRGPFRFEGSLALTDARVRASGSATPLNGLRPAQTPKISASGTLGWSPSPGFDLAVTLRHTGAQFEDDLQTDMLAPATTLGAFVSVPIGRVFSLVLRGENLTDTAIVTRNVAGSIDLGTPRTLWVGVRVKIR